MQIAFILAAICLFFQAERALLDTITIFRVLSNRKKALKKKESTCQMFILIPVLEEQKIIAETIRAMGMAFDDARIVIITTERERSTEKSRGKKQLTTGDVVREALKSGVLKKMRNRVDVVHYPNPRGRMAHQINFAVRHYASRYPDGYFILYNADSIPSAQSADAFQRAFQAHPNAVVQQPCAFVRDAGRMATPFVNSLSLFQSLFCIGHETGLIRRYTKRLRHGKGGWLKEFLFSPLGWIVGHGSAMSLRTCLQHEGFPEKYMNEDLTFGYLLSAKQVPIYSLSVLEVADVPLTWKRFIRQKTVWFWNFLEYIRCYTDLRRPDIPHGRRLALFIIGCARAAYWFLSGIFFGLPILLAIIFWSHQLFFMGIAGFFFFSFMPTYCLKRLLPKALAEQGLDEYALRVQSIPTLHLIWSLPIVVLSDSIGPWIATAQWIRWKIWGIFPDKPKTT